MPIPYLSKKLPNLVIVDWCLIASQEVNAIEEMVDHDLDDLLPMDTSCEAIEHQSTIMRFGWTKKVLALHQTLLERALIISN